MPDNRAAHKLTAPAILSHHAVSERATPGEQAASRHRGQNRAFTKEFLDEATSGTGIDELVAQAKALLLDAVARTPLMGLPAAEQTKLAKAL